MCIRDRYQRRVRGSLSIMKHIAAYLLAVLGGNANPDAKAIKEILSAADVEGDDDKINKLLDELKGKDIEQIIAAGQAKLSSVPSGGGGGGVPVAAKGAAPATSAAPGKTEDKKVEKEKEKEPEKEKEESDEDMGFGLFEDE
eukprot:TRINITY_DN150_c0_g2_i1.p2 TRINITY_DN150_c0_g2~~TRINITY_DN150_c0_g2_i1.p2  ORF type:complete len:142 (-),score=66.13 TRINITY_DN150_c0_g2_i1:93-518(-)